jgi:uncharacterized protein
MKKRSHRQKHIPERTCVGCRDVNSKQEMVRIVRTDEGVSIDPTGRQPGRGAYLHRLKSCWQSALTRGLLAKALKAELDSESVNELKEFLEHLPEK